MVVGLIVMMLGVYQVLLHDLFTRYTTGNIAEKLTDEKEGGVNVSYRVTYTHPESGKSHSAIWNAISIGSKQVGDAIEVAYQTNKPESQFGPAYRRQNSLNAKLLLLIGMAILLGGFWLRSQLMK